MSRVAAHRFDNDLRYRAADHPQQTALTPGYLLDPIREALGGIDLDPCTTPENPVGARSFIAPPRDGIGESWIGAATIYVNPPYGKSREPWVSRCIAEARVGVKVILLMPAATDTLCFQRAARSAAEVLFVRGRVKFGVLRPNRRQVAASHPSALFAWNCSLDSCAHLGLRMA